jgi:hypothetical protein
MHAPTRPPCHLTPFSLAAHADGTARRVPGLHVLPGAPTTRVRFVRVWAILLGFNVSSFKPPRS